MYLAALTSYFFKNSQVAAPHPNPNLHPCFPEQKCIQF